MQIVKKIIGFIIVVLSLIIAFILVNILVAWLRFWSFSWYFNMLDSKSWATVSEELTWNPVSRVKVFYEDTANSQSQVDLESEELLNNLDTLLPRDTDSTELGKDELDDDLSDSTFQVSPEDEIDTWDDWDNWENPYDPDFEDEFNSFFAGE